MSGDTEISSSSSIQCLLLWVITDRFLKEMFQKNLSFQNVRRVFQNCINWWLLSQLLIFHKFWKPSVSRTATVCTIEKETNFVTHSLHGTSRNYTSHTRRESSRTRTTLIEHKRKGQKRESHCVFVTHLMTGMSDIWEVVAIAESIYEWKNDWHNGRQNPINFNRVAISLNMKEEVSVRIARQNPLWQRYFFYTVISSWMKKNTITQSCSQPYHPEAKQKDHEVGSKGSTLFSNCSLSRRNMICAAMVESIVLDCLLITRPNRDHTRSEGAEVGEMERKRRARRARRGNSDSSAFHWTSGCDCGAYHGRKGAAGLNQCASSHCTSRILLDLFLLLHLHVAIHVNCRRPTCRHVFFSFAVCSSCMSGGGWLFP